MPETYTTLAVGQLANSSTTIYTVPNSTKLVNPSLNFYNTGATTQTIKVNLDNGTSRQFFQLDLEAGAYANISDIFNRTILEATHLIKAETTNATTVNYWLSGVLIT